MYLSTGRMNRRARKAHHTGWIRLFTGKRMNELWLGDLWITFGR